jgi:hypothetical protein
VASTEGSVPSGADGGVGGHRTIRHGSRITSRTDGNNALNPAATKPRSLDSGSSRSALPAGGMGGGRAGLLPKPPTLGDLLGLTRAAVADHSARFRHRDAATAAISQRTTARRWPH